MSELGFLFLRSAFVDNMPLILFLGLCTFLALSKQADAALGLGVAKTGVLGITVPLNHLIYSAVLAPGAWAWAGMPELDLSYLALIAFIGVIAAAVQVLEMILDRFFPKIHAAFGVFLPLLTVQCAILAGSLFMVERSYTLAESAVFGLGRGVGFTVAVCGMTLIALAKRDEVGAAYPLLVLVTAGAPFSWAVFSVLSKPLAHRVSPLLWTYLVIAAGGGKALGQRPGDAGADRRHEVDPQRAEVRREDRHRDHQPVWLPDAF